jgi:hypothetical protein
VLYYGYAPIIWWTSTPSTQHTHPVVIHLLTDKTN